MIKVPIVIGSAPFCDPADTTSAHIASVPPEPTTAAQGQRCAGRRMLPKIGSVAKSLLGSLSLIEEAFINQIETEIESETEGDEEE